MSLEMIVQFSYLIMAVLVQPLQVKVSKYRSQAFHPNDHFHYPILTLLRYLNFCDQAARPATGMLEENSF